MEAATPLRQPRITVLANRVLVDGLAIDDPTAVELVRAREEAGDDPARVVGDAIEIGARVLHREQTGANVEFVKTEFEKSARQLDAEFVERARRVVAGLLAGAHEVDRGRVLDGEPVDEDPVAEDRDAGLAERGGSFHTEDVAA